MPDKIIHNKTSQYVRVAQNQDGEGLEMFPTDFNGPLDLGTVAVSFPGVIGLKYKTPDGLFWHLLMDHDKTFFYEPSDGWANKTFIVIFKKEEPVPEIVQIRKDMHELRDTLTFEVHALRRDVDKQIKDLDTRITDLDKRVTDLDKRLSELTTKINQMETNLLAMESNLLAAVMDKKNYMLQVNWNKLLQFIHKFKKSLHFLCGDFYGIF